MKGKRNSCRGVRWSLQGSEWESNSKHGEAVETEAGIKENTDAGHEGDGETTQTKH